MELIADKNIGETNTLPQATNSAAIPLSSSVVEALRVTTSMPRLLDYIPS